MTADEIQYVSDVIESEGTDYGLNEYTNFERVKDKEFHRLLKAYCKARNELFAHVWPEDYA